MLPIGSALDKLDEFICLLHRRPCDVTIAYMYIATMMLKRNIVQL